MPRKTDEFTPRQTGEFTSVADARTLARWLEAGTSAILSHRYEEAVAAFTEVLSIEPDHRTALANLKRLASMGHRPVDALKKPR